MCHMSCHMSHVTYHVSCVACHLSLAKKNVKKKLLKRLDKVVELVGGGFVINGANIETYLNNFFSCFTPIN